jgi:broad specificity phosphatase PhoE
VAEQTELVLVRHGEAVVNLGPVLDDTCHGLTELGRTQAASLARRLAWDPATDGRDIAAILHSPVRRCAETAEILHAAVPAALVEVPELAGPVHGEPGISPWDPAANLIGTIPPLAPTEQPHRGAESWHQFVERSGAALLAAAGRYQSRRVLIVAHSETSAAALQTFLRLPADASRWSYTLMRHTALTTWTHEFSQLPGADPAGSWCLLRHNDDRHLDQPAIASRTAGSVEADAGLSR